MAKEIQRILRLTLAFSQRTNSSQKMRMFKMMTTPYAMILMLQKQMPSLKMIIWRKKVKKGPMPILVVVGEELYTVLYEGASGLKWTFIDQLTEKAVRACLTELLLQRAKAHHCIIRYKDRSGATYGPSKFVRK